MAVLSSDVSVSGGSVSGFGSGGGGHTTPMSALTFPSTVTVTIPKVQGTVEVGYANDVVSKSFQASYPASFSTTTLGDVECGTTPRILMQMELQILDSVREMR